MATQDGRIVFENIHNVRDLGRHINTLTSQDLLRSSILYRGARPDAATPADRHLLVKDLRIRTIIDLRTPTEHIEQTRQHASKDIPSAPALTPNDPKHPLRIQEITYKDVNFNGSGYSSALIKQLSYGNVAKLAGLYAFGWRKEAISVLGKNVMAERGLSGLAIDSLEHCKKEVKEVFDVLCDESSYPIMFHCTQGKDRTGLIALLALMLCNVPEDAIEKDYRLSESELASEREDKITEVRSIGLPDSFADCPKDWTRTVHDHVNSKLGGVEKYLEDCGVTKAQQAELKALLKYE